MINVLKFKVNLVNVKNIWVIKWNKGDTWYLKVNIIKILILFSNHMGISNLYDSNMTFIQLKTMTLNFFIYD